MASGYLEDFRAFPQAMHENSGMIPTSGNDCLLPNAFQSIIR
jgi:hypothetical protein